jgi:rhamnosyltransferase
LEKGHTWVWTFDDDSVPHTNALATLLEGLRKASSPAIRIGMAVPMPIHRETATPYPPHLWRDGFVKASQRQIRQSIWFADLAVVSGSLVRREVVEDVGLPRADFFMDVFDLEYCLRLRSHGYKIAVITDAEIAHEVGNARKIDLPGYKRLWTNQPPWREYYISRNLTYLAWWLHGNSATKRSISRYLVVHAVQVLLFSTNKLRCLIRMVQGFYDGLRGRLGIRLRPASDSSPRRGDSLNAAEHIEAEKA